MILNGLLNDNVEILRDAKFRAYATRSGRVKVFAEFHEQLRARLNQEYMAEALTQKCVALMVDGNFDAQVERFTACRYGAVDSVEDYNEHTGSMTPDFSMCQHRHSCPGFGVVCLLPVTETGDRLTPRELDVLEQLMTGAPDKQSHYCLGIAADTYNELKRRVFAKLGAHSKVEAVVKASKIIAFN